VKPWVRVLALFAAVMLAALFLKVLPPLLVLALFVVGVAWANQALTSSPKRAPVRTAAQMLGLESVPAERFALTAYLFALFERGHDARVHEVMQGGWRGSRVQMFDLAHVTSAPAGTPAPERSFTCVLTLAPLDAPHLLVEPHGFLTPVADRPGVPIAETAPERIGRIFDVRCSDGAFAAAFLDERMSDWLLGEGDRWGFEVIGAALLLYGPAVPVKDRDLVLEALQAFLDRIPEEVRTAAEPETPPSPVETSPPPPVETPPPPVET
jgi:hypothetical protein